MLITNFGTIPSQGGLMLPDWSYGREITIPANSIDADLTNFPCTVILNSTNFDFSKAKSDGSDIRFTDKNFNHNKFEKVEYSTNYMDISTSTTGTDRYCFFRAITCDSTKITEFETELKVLTSGTTNGQILRFLQGSKDVIVWFKTNEILIKNSSNVTIGTITIDTTKFRKYKFVLTPSIDLKCYVDEELKATFAYADLSNSAAKVIYIGDNTTVANNGGQVQWISVKLTNDNIVRAYWDAFMGLPTANGWDLIGTASLATIVNGFAKFTVLIPTVSDLTDTKFYVWAGNPNAYNTSIESWQDQTGKALTYNGNVKMVYSSIYGRRVASFDGLGDYFTIPDDNGFNTGTSNFCLERKLVFDSLPANGKIQVFYSRWSGDSPLNTIYAYISNTSGTYYIGFAVYQNGTLLVNASFAYSVSINTFYDIAFCRYSGALHTFVNGTEIGSVNTSANFNVITTGTVLRIGSYNTSTTDYFLNGRDLGIRLTNGRERYTSTYTPPTKFEIDGSDVVFCSNFDTIYSQDYAMVQHMGDSLVDATGNGNNGTATGTTVVSTDYGKVRQFDGTDDKITTALFANTDNVTLTVMATKVGTGGTDLLFYVGTSGTNGYGLYTNSLKFSLKAGSTFADTTVSNTTTPQVVTLTRTSGTWTAIIDGISYAVTNLSVTTPTGATYFGGNTTDYYDGQLSNARYSTVARSVAYTKAEQKALKNTLLTITGA